MDISVTGAKIFFQIPVPLFGNLTITEVEVNTLIIMAVITLISIFLTRNLKVKPTSKRQIVAELLVKTASDFVESNMGKRFAGFAPFIAAMFSLSALSSLSSLIGMYPTTSDLSTLLGWAIMVFCMITFFKIKTSGFGGYLLGYTKPFFAFTPFNIISEFATPISMAFRHFGNIASGGIITSLIYAALAGASSLVLSWVPVVLNNSVGVFIGNLPILQVGIPAVLSIYFDVFASCLQAFIFCMLTMMYIHGACETD